MTVGGHVKSGQFYLDATLAELKEELFYDTELPSDVALVEIGKYKNDSRPTNREFSILYYTIYGCPFFLSPEEVEAVYWQNRHDI